MTRREEKPGYSAAPFVFAKLETIYPEKKINNTI
jgi:hypothetical protein